jgi:hypothetical protein
MTDKELLELAAKAADIVVVRSRLDDPMNQDFLVENSHRNEHQASGPWNPLTDDGDALRLAVKLRIGLGDRETTITAFHRQDMSSGGLYVEEVGDPYAATRRAVTRAAAEIGKGISLHIG